LDSDKDYFLIMAEGIALLISNKENLFVKLKDMAKMIYTKNALAISFFHYSINSCDRIIL